MSTKVGKTSNEARIRYIVSVSLFTAFAYVVSVLTGFIKVQFLTFDAKDCIIAVGALSLGPVAGALTAALVALLEFLLSSTTGVYGLIMNFISSATFSVTASLIYRARRSFIAAIVGLYSAVLATAGVMMLANYLITPYYMGAPRAAVVSMMFPLLLPFNLIKALLNASLTLLIYKHITRALGRVGLLDRRRRSAVLDKSSASTSAFPWRTVLISAVAVVLLTAGILVYFLVLDAKIEPFWN